MGYLPYKCFMFDRSIAEIQRRFEFEILFGFTEEDENAAKFNTRFADSRRIRLRYSSKHT